MMAMANLKDVGLNVVDSKGELRESEQEELKKREMLSVMEKEMLRLMNRKISFREVVSQVVQSNLGSFKKATVNSSNVNIILDRKKPDELFNFEETDDVKDVGLLDISSTSTIAVPGSNTLEDTEIVICTTIPVVENINTDDDMKDVGFLDISSTSTIDVPGIVTLEKNTDVVGFTCTTLPVPETVIKDTENVGLPEVANISTIAVWKSTSTDDTENVGLLEISSTSTPVLKNISHSEEELRMKSNVSDRRVEELPKRKSKVLESTTSGEPLTKKTKQIPKENARASVTSGLPSEKIMKEKQNIICGNYIKTFDVTKCGNNKREVINALRLLSKMNLSDTRNKTYIELYMAETYKLRYFELYNNSMKISYAAEIFTGLQVYDYLPVEYHLIYDKSRNSREQFELSVSNIFEAELQKNLKKPSTHKESREALEDYKLNPEDPELKRTVSAALYFYSKSKGSLKGTLLSIKNTKNALNRAEPFVQMEPKTKLWDPRNQMEILIEMSRISLVKNFYEGFMAVYYYYWIFYLNYAKADKALFKTFDIAATPATIKK